MHTAKDVRAGNLDMNMRVDKDRGFTGLRFSGRVKRFEMSAIKKGEKSSIIRL